MAITKGAGATATNVTFSGSVPNHQTTLGIGSAVSAGSLLSVQISSFQGGAHSISATDSVNGSAYTVDRTSAADDFGDITNILTFPNSGAGTPTVTIKSSVATTVAGSIAYTEWRGMATATPADVGTSNKASSGATATTGTTAATSQADELVLASLANGNGNTALTENAGAEGFTLLVEFENGSLNVQSSHVYKIVAATGAQVHTWTQTSVTYTAGIQTYKAAAAGGATTRGRPFGQRGNAFNGGRTFFGIIDG